MQDTRTHTQEEEGEEEIGLPQIVYQKLKDPSLPLSPEDSLKVLLACIKYGEVKGRKAESKELLMVIGNTGAGKSPSLTCVLALNAWSSVTREQARALRSHVY
jgi:hypothetical protein